jgi:uncharacterized protein (TIGR02118 family)
MIKMFATIPRKPGLTAPQFHDHWRHPHGTLTRKISTITAYVQSHKLDSPHVPASQCAYDGAAEVWYDNLADALNMKDEPAYLRYNVPDEPRFVDMEGLKFILTEEEVVDSKIDILTASDEGDIAWSSRTAPVAVKLLQFIASDGHAAWAAGEDIDLARRLGAFRHVRCRPVQSVYGENPPFLGIRELFWPTQTVFETCVARAPEALARIIALAGPATQFLAQAERVI